jgi:hypothetical protein
MDWARDFDSNFVLKIEGILDVFQDFYKQKLGQKNRPRHKKELLEVPNSSNEFGFFRSSSRSIDCFRGLGRHCYLIRL